MTGVHEGLITVKVDSQGLELHTLQNHMTTRTQLAIDSIMLVMMVDWVA